MKAAIVVAVFCLAVAVTVEGYGVYEDLAGLDRTEDTRTEKRGNYNKTPEAAAAAKLCKPYIDSCRQSTSSKSEQQLCFRKFATGCFFKITNGLKELGSCINSAGGSLEHIQECLANASFQK